MMVASLVVATKASHDWEEVVMVFVVQMRSVAADEGKPDQMKTPLEEGELVVIVEISPETG